jgi:DNA-binding transcriptional MocR family regulator
MSGETTRHLPSQKRERQDPPGPAGGVQPDQAGLPFGTLQFEHLESLGWPHIQQGPIQWFWVMGALTPDLTRVVPSWTTEAGPLYIQLADAIRRAIERGEIPAGSRLPPERTLAKALTLSRTTVVAAYDALRSDAYIISRRGSGTFVGPRLRKGWPSIGAEELSSTIQKAVPVPAVADAIELSAAAFPGRDVITRQVMSSAHSILAHSLTGHGYSPLGLDELRARIAEHLSQTGLRTSIDQVLVTGGAQEAIYLVSILFLRPGDRVLIEDPTWLGAIDAYRASRASVVSVKTNQDGVLLDDLTDKLKREEPSLVHVSPSFNNPSGTVTSQRTRLQLAAMIETSGIPLVEDNTLADLGLGRKSLAPVAAGSRTAVILTIGSLSKLLWGGLRVGWVRGPEPVINRLGQLKLVVDHGSSLPSQAIATVLMADIQKTIEHRRAEAEVRLAALETALRERLPEWQWRRPDGGLSLWVRLPRGTSAEYAHVAFRHGVHLVPGNMASAQGNFADHLRLPFVRPPETLELAVERLAGAWHTYEQALDRRSVQRVIV